MFVCVCVCEREREIDTERFKYWEVRQRQRELNRTQLVKTEFTLFKINSCMETESLCVYVCRERQTKNIKEYCITGAK